MSSCAYCYDYQVSMLLPVHCTKLVPSLRQLCATRKRPTPVLPFCYPGTNFTSITGMPARGPDACVYNRLCMNVTSDAGNLSYPCCSLYRPSCCCMGLHPAAHHASAIWPLTCEPVQACVQNYLAKLLPSVLCLTPDAGSS